MWGNKKAKQLIYKYLAFYFVTADVEKSNFYKDLEMVKECNLPSQKK